ncbi:hypothetical protein EMIHUDRAFT_446168 [Emiliania huxleyi CCMP1516]|uniref:ACB domain-containing protein n=4 Tax=Emiliania huxleyi TaxID=2903 RepID=A0A0D3IHN9_EMIH1|nr:hypothetical protein EMIHUDRAFT_446168 [Emiliania huxleyi CCMP1516]EOD10774.1 hypothetical protein EMIHUDRAFT_446168 [Emiliania huxleyi CCMP1516]|eukprot:XP_005763203.1 hypothetical protein EMIHUDRAFT_446168 [Emiliania huxleyi CCMP1516]
MSPMSPPVPYPPAGFVQRRREEEALRPQLPPQSVSPSTNAKASLNEPPSTNAKASLNEPPLTNAKAILGPCCPCLPLMSTWADQIEAARGQHSDVATFDAACSWVQDVAAPQRLLPDACLLRLYAAFKQATVGPAPPRSGQLDPKKRAKWQAWDAVRSLDKREARHLYCTLVTQFSAAAAAATPTRGGQPPTPTPKPTSAPAAATELLPVTSRVLSFGPSRSGAVVYRVASRWAGGGSVSTHRRFSDFRTLHTALRSPLSLGEFPCARAPFQTSALAARRVGELSAYISSLLSTACDALAAADGAGAAGGGARLAAVVLVDFLGGRPEPRAQTPTPSKPTVGSAAAAAASSGGDEPAAVAPKPLGGSALKCGGGMLASLAVCIGPAAPA